MSPIEKILAVLVWVVSSAAIWMMIGAGIAEGLRSEFEDKERRHEQHERQLKRSIPSLATAMYLNALARTRVNVTMRAAVVEDDLGKGRKDHV